MKNFNNLQTFPGQERTGCNNSLRKKGLFLNTRKADLTTYEKLKKILIGTDAKSSLAYKKLLNSIKNKATVNLLWYPSAGLDFKDILETQHLRANTHKIEDLPDLYVHNDYIFSQNTIDILNKEILYEDGRTTVRLLEKHELQLNPVSNINYHINPEYAAFADCPSLISPTPKIYLLDIKITSNKLGVIKQKVLYFFFENYNFLSEVILKHKIPISHIIKVREGCGFGGNNKSITAIYEFLSVLRTKYLIVDNEIHFKPEFNRRIINQHGLFPRDYNLTLLNENIIWSGFSTNVFKVNYNRQALTSIRLIENLQMIGGERFDYNFFR